MENQPSRSPFSSVPNPFNQLQQPSDPGGNKKKYFIVGAAVLAVFVLIGIGVALLGTSGGQDSSVQKNSQFTNWLAPTQDLKIGNFRYVSACQALSIDDVESTVGGLDGTDVVSEQYLDSSMPDASRPYETSCRYGGDVSLFANQYTDIADVKRTNSVVYSLGDEKLDEKIAKFDSIAGSTSNEDVKNLITTVKSSVETHKKYEKEYKSDVLAGIKTDGLIIPVTSGLYGFNIFKNNVVYRLELKTDKKATEEISQSNQTIEKHLEHVQKLVNRLLANTSKADLSQSPAPTIIGSSEKRGETTILESCSILSKAVFKEVTGLDDNSPIERQSAVVDVEAKRNTLANKGPLLPYNTCKRENDSAGNVLTSAGTDTSLLLNLEYAANKEEALEKLTKGGFNKLDADDASLQTDADWAVSKRVGTYDPYYMFQVGPYVGTVKYSFSKSGGVRGGTEQGDQSQQDHIRAINALVKSLKADLAKSKSSE